MRSYHCQQHQLSMEAVAAVAEVVRVGAEGVDETASDLFLLVLCKLLKIAAFCN